MIRFVRPLAVVLVALVLCQCGVPQPPQCRSVPMSSRQAPELLLSEAREAWQVLRVHSMGHRADEARVKYNQAVTKLFDQLRCGADGWDTRAAALGTVVDRSAALMNPDELDAVIDARSVRPRKVQAHRYTEGVGVVTIGWKETSPVGMPRKAFQLPNGLPFQLNVMLNFDGKQPRWEFRKRWRDEEAKIGGVTHALAADWTAPNEFYWRMCQLDDLLIQNVLLPDRFTEETGIYFITPYDPKKIPVVFVHGLVSSPDAFKNTLNELMPEKWFRDNYQVWLYNYPTGNPWLYSSYQFREKMREAAAYARSRGPDDKLNQMVVVGHSMGGLLTRSSVTDPGTALYDATFRKPLSQLELRDGQKKLIKGGFLYEPLTEPKRVVFMAVPHRGSPVATWGPSQWVAQAIRLPKTLTVELLDNTLLTVLSTVNETRKKPQFSSIATLSPNSPSTRTLADLPLPEHIAFHSIMGDRGRGNTPNCSDGVVPYWSSHVSPVESEKIVPKGHGVPDCPEAAAEMKRILKLHLDDRR